MPAPDLSSLDCHSPHEELANSLSHGLAALAAAAGLSVLVVLAARGGDPWRIVSFSIYGATLVLLYCVSAFYHGFSNPRVKHVFRILDHSAIYLLIAGTYTPFVLVTLRGPWGWTLFGVAWGVALLGVLQAVLAPVRFKLLGLAADVALGWLIVVAWKPLTASLAAGGVAWLIGGGLFYTLGIAFYAVKRIPYNHAVWHLFVLCGSACHFAALLLYVLPE